MGRNMKKYQIHISCRPCGSPLFDYWKEGEGHLVKCYADGINRDYTKDQHHCPECGTEFARDAIIHNRPAYKIIQGKVVVRR